MEKVYSTDRKVKRTQACHTEISTFFFVLVVQYFLREKNSLSSLLTSDRLAFF